MYLIFSLPLLVPEINFSVLKGEATFLFIKLRWASSACEGLDYQNSLLYNIRELVDAGGAGGGVKVWDLEFFLWTLKDFHCL
jgi:hypothetical protein